ncbi:sodium:proton antiporter, partial [Streptomyces sp. B22F1]
FSIVAHSSTDVPIARMFDVEDLVGLPNETDRAAGHDLPKQRQPGPDRARS